MFSFFQVRHQYWLTYKRKVELNVSNNQVSLLATVPFSPADVCLDWAATRGDTKGSIEGTARFHMQTGSSCLLHAENW
jgi:hypothetical protein